MSTATAGAVAARPELAPYRGRMVAGRPVVGPYRRGLWYNIGMDKLYRSSDEKVVAGVCAGLAHKLDLNANGLRCVVVLVTIFMTGIPLFVYAALWMILKERPTGGGVIDV